MAHESPNVFSIPSSAPFLRTLIRALMNGEIVKGFTPAGDPLALTGATLYLPTRRACRLARDTFIEVMDGDAALLPRIVPVGDIDEDEIAFAQAPIAETFDHPEAIGTIERKLLLAGLIRKWAELPGVRTGEGVRLVASNPASVLALADELARLMDDFIARGADWTKLDTLVPDELDDYWKTTLGFLKIARDAWPAVLAERGKIEGAERQKLMIAAEAKRLAATASGPVVAAGSTGSTPTTATLLATIARLPQGAVVLPGLDIDLDDPSWDMIGSDAPDKPQAYGHPQFALHGLLRRIGITRSDVKILGTPQAHGREMLVSEALRPAEATHHWQSRLHDDNFAVHTDAAMKNIAVIEAANAEDEALAIAIALREAIDDGTDESRARTAALITPDRALARRVLAALARWQVPADDSGGDGLGDTPAGLFARLVAEVALGGAEPVPLLALLKQPLCRIGAHESAHERAIETLERAVLRGPRPARGTRGLRDALSAFGRSIADLHPSDPRKTITAEELSAAHALASVLSAALAPLENLPASPRPFAELAALHRTVIEALSKDTDGKPAAFAPKPPDTAKLLEFFAEIDDTGCRSEFPLPPSDYAEAFRAAIAGKPVRRPGAPNARVRILGPLEARLLQADRVVLGGLVEGVWPPDPQTDPWLSRPMRKELGLDLPERRIGLAAHDFAQALGAGEIVLSHAGKREGSPTVESRFLQRLAAVAGKERWERAAERGRRYLQWAQTLDHVSDPKPCGRPAPRPPREVRPMSLSVTEIEHWLRDPYTIYAKHILKLQPLDDIDIPPGARDRGIIIHEALAEFTETFAKTLPADPRAELLAIGKKHFAELAAYPEAEAFWWPRFVRIANWFVTWDAGRREGLKSLDAEIRGRLEIPVGDRTFVLRTRADRIEHRADGTFAILDYKTGQIPSDKQVRIGLSPQMTLEAAMLREGAFGAEKARAPVGELVYVAVKGGRDGGEALPVKFKDSAPDQEADSALAKLKTLVSRFDNDTQEYKSVPIPMWRLAYGAYDHLARIKEWSAAGEEDAAE